MTYLELLKNNKVARNLWLNQFLGGLGSWFSNVAIYTLLVAFHADALTISLVAAIHLLPGVLQAPIVGPLIDKIAPRTMMSVLLCIEFCATVLLVTVDSPSLLWLMFILIFIKMGAASFYFTTDMALMPKILKGDALKMANDLFAMSWSLTFVLGMSLGAVVVHYLGTTSAFLIDGALFIVAGFVLLKIPFPQHIAPPVQPFFALIKEGIIYIKSHHIIAHLILLHASVGLTAFDALVTLLAKHHYSSILAIPLVIGWINGVRAAGLMFGPFLLRLITVPSEKVLTYVFVGQGVSILLWALLQDYFWLALIGVFLTGIFTTTIWSVTYSMVQENTDPSFHGRVIAYNDMIFLLTNIATSITIGLLASFNVSLWEITSIIGCGFFGFAFYYHWYIKNKLVFNENRCIV